jgi:hypothetical protein
LAISKVANAVDKDMQESQNAKKQQKTTNRKNNIQGSVATATRPPQYELSRAATFTERHEYVIGAKTQNKPKKKGFALIE